MILDGKWKKSDHIKCMAIFILQLALIYIVAKCLNVSGVLAGLFLVGFCGILFGSVNAFGQKYAPHKVCIGLAVYLCASYMLANFNGFFTDVRREYHELKSFSGILFEPSDCNRRGSSCGERIFLKSPEGDSSNLKSDEQYSDFYCDRFIGGSCNKELQKYFGKPLVYLRGEVITVKYAEFRHHADLLPFITDKRGLVYEMSHDGKVIYPYEYFIEKYSTGKRNFFIFTLFLLGTSIGFCFIYKNIKPTPPQNDGGQAGENAQQT